MPDNLAPAMNILLDSIISFLRNAVRTRSSLQVENLALRHQLNVLRRSQKVQLQLSRADRIFWGWLSRIWSGWRSALVIVKPETVIGWHRQGFRLYWRWKSRSRGAGRPCVPRAVRDLIRRMSMANPIWGAPRIHGELLKLGINIAEPTVAKYLARHRKPPSQTWRTFLKNHASQIVAADFFVVPTVNLRLLLVFVVLAHHRRRVIHFNITEHPTAEWTAQQMREAFPFDKAPRFLIRDHDGCYGEFFRQTIRSLNIEEVLTVLPQFSVVGSPATSTNTNGYPDFFALQVCKERIPV